MNSLQTATSLVKSSIEMISDIEKAYAHMGNVIGQKKMRKWRHESKQTDRYLSDRRERDATAGLKEMTKATPVRPGGAMHERSPLEESRKDTPVSSGADGKIDWGKHETDSRNKLGQGYQRPQDIQSAKKGEEMTNEWMNKGDEMKIKFPPNKKSTPEETQERERNKTDANEIDKASAAMDTMGFSHKQPGTKPYPGKEATSFEPTKKRKKGGIQKAICELNKSMELISSITDLVEKAYSRPGRMMKEPQDRAHGRATSSQAMADSDRQSANVSGEHIHRQYVNHKKNGTGVFAKE